MSEQVRRGFVPTDQKEFSGTKLEILREAAKDLLYLMNRGYILIRGVDGTIRDLAGLRGNYRIIDKTEVAVRSILEMLDALKIKKATIYLDAPVSNSGRLKQLFMACAKGYRVQVEVQVENSVDSLLSGMSGVVSTDAIILNQCASWVNLGSMIIEQKIPMSWCISIT